MLCEMLCDKAKYHQGPITSSTVKKLLYSMSAIERNLRIQRFAAKWDISEP